MFSAIVAAEGASSVEALHHVRGERGSAHVPSLSSSPIPCAQVGKTTLIQSLTKHYTKYNLHDVKGPVTLIAGKKRRLTFIECSTDLDIMVRAFPSYQVESAEPGELQNRGLRVRQRDSCAVTTT
jgi:hypothetical protein